MIGMATGSLKCSVFLLVYSSLLFITPYPTANATQVLLESVLQETASPISRLISPKVSQFIETLRNTSGIQGIAVGVVQTSSDDEPDVEFGSWGSMAEGDDGHDMTQEVRWTHVL